jgi:hypothetical protein
VARLAEARHECTVKTELKRLSFIALIVVDAGGYIPFDPEAGNLMFRPVSDRDEPPR